ncbi:filamentous hemagglutinin N-terminal domain-containing protein [[Haemophilus] felis]|nr:filamentous hemagglutinin N-terminal domain-containing protein [[Haemophilus] felis]
MKLNQISLAIYAMATSAVSFANILPQGHRVQSGEASIATAGSDMTITQTSDRVKIDWESFDIGASNKVTFVQPQTTSVAYNRVTGGNASQIQGKLEANGRVFLANPNGVIFSKTASVNVGALLATTKALNENANIDNKKEPLQFKQIKEDEGDILNQGTITATGTQNGFVVLFGKKVKNEGKITANNYSHSESRTERRRVCDIGYDAWCDTGAQGGKWIEYDETITTTTTTPAQVILGAGKEFSLDLDDSNNSIDIRITENQLNQLIENNGVIMSNEGYITLTTGGKNEVFDGLINNNGILQANAATDNNGTITLSAYNVNLGKNSQIKAEKELQLTSPKYRDSINKKDQRAVKISSEKGSEILARKTKVVGDKIHMEGEFSRGEEKRFFNEEFGNATNEFELQTGGLVYVADQKGESEAPHFISTTALSSILASHGKTKLQLGLRSYKKVVDGERIREQGELRIRDNINVQAFRNSDSTLKFIGAKLDIQDANIQSAGRLNIIHEIPANIRTNDANVILQNTTLDLGNGSFGVGRNAVGGRYYLNKPSNTIEEDQLNSFDVTLNNLTLNRVDDFVISGGFRNLNIDHLSHTGRSNFYFHGGNKFTYKTQPGYEYAIQDIEERVLRSRKNHGGERPRRWQYSQNLRDILLSREFVDGYDMWNVQPPRTHLETSINIRNSNIKTHDGFIQLLAKNINIENSKFDVSFDRSLIWDGLWQRIHKVAMNGEVVLNNSHIKLMGADIRHASPDSSQAAAAFFLVGNLVGKNQSSILAKTHQGYTLRTDGNASLKGETGQEDLKITLINTGVAQHLNVGITEGHADEGNTAFSPGDAANTKTTLENVTLDIFAPNGAPAYYSSNAVPIEIKNSNVTFFEQPRTNRIEASSLRGNATKLTQREALRRIDKSLGIAQTNLQAAQVSAVADNKLTFEAGSALENIEVEKEVTMAVCNEGEECQNLSLGNQHSEMSVTVGEIK